MRSPDKMGDECPGGRSVFQTTFFFGPNSTGRFLLSETPDPFGPRNCGQLSAENSEKTPSNAVASRSFVISPRLKTIQEILGRGHCQLMSGRLVACAAVGNRRCSSADSSRAD